LFALSVGGEVEVSFGALFCEVTVNLGALFCPFCFPVGLCLCPFCLTLRLELIQGKAAYEEDSRDEAIPEAPSAKAG
jgi:hypothetical protein